MVNEEMQAVLAARTCAYRAFQSLFGNHPTLEQLSLLGGPEVEASLALLCGGGDDACGEELRFFQNSLDTILAVPDQALGALKSDYNRLFVVPGPMAAAAWESVYRSSNKVLFTEVTLQVREAYRAQGFLPNDYPVVADDHLALELDFMAALAQEAAEASLLPSEEEQAALLRPLRASRRFLEEHLLLWAPSFTEALCATGDQSLYRDVALLLSAFLRRDADRCREIVETLC